VKNKKVGAGAFFLKIGEFPRILGIPEKFWEFPKISRNSRGDFLNFGKNKKKKCWGTKIGEKKLWGRNGNIFFSFGLITAPLRCS